MRHTSPVHVLVGPSTSSAVICSLITHREFLFRSEGRVHEFVFSSASHAEFVSLLDALSHVRKVVVRVGDRFLDGAQFRRQHLCEHVRLPRACVAQLQRRRTVTAPFGCRVIWDRGVRPSLGGGADAIALGFVAGVAAAREHFCGLLDEPAEAEHLARFLPELEEARLTPPGAELLSLASRCEGGEWEIREGLLDDERQGLLDVLHGCHYEPQAVVDMARDIEREDDGEDARRVSYRVGDALGLASWAIEPAVRRGMDLAHSDRQLASMMASGRSRGIQNPLVWMMTGPQTCATCRRLYLEADGKTPRLFFVNELPAPGANKGVPLERWLPTRPPLHMTCYCMMQPVMVPPSLTLGSVRPGALRVTRVPSFEREVLPEPYR